MLTVTPTTDMRRTWAMCLGVALPLAGAGAIAVGVMTLIDSVNTIPPEDLQSAGELAQIPFILAGAGLLGVRWLHFAGGVVVTFVAATLGGVVLFGRFDSGIWWMAGLLEKAGLVVRAPSPDDERSTTVTITDAGRKRLAEVLPGHIEVVGGLLFEPLSRDDVETLASLLAPVRDHMRSTPPRSAAPRRTREG